MRFAPSLLTVIGAVWLGWLTFSNMMFVYYDWSGPVLAEDKRATWTEEDVKSAFVRFGTDSRDQVARQMLPVFLVLACGICCGIQAFRHSNKANKVVEPTSQSSAAHG